MSKEKDTSVIPEGVYCYVPDLEKNANKDKDDLTFYIKHCPYISTIEDEGVILPYCKFLELGGINNSTSEEGFDKLEAKYGEDGIWEKYPLDLLWDSVKQCGENSDYDDFDIE